MYGVYVCNVAPMCAVGVCDVLPIGVVLWWLYDVCCGLCVYVPCKCGMYACGGGCECGVCTGEAGVGHEMYVFTCGAVCSMVRAYSAYGVGERVLRCITCVVCECMWWLCFMHVWALCAVFGMVCGMLCDVWGVVSVVCGVYVARALWHACMSRVMCGMCACVCCVWCGCMCCLYDGCKWHVQCVFACVGCVVCMLCGMCGVCGGQCA